MATPPGDSHSDHPLEPLLRDAEAELKRRLREACEAEAGGVSNDSSAEIRQLEDTLLAAAVAAEQTIALRRHIERRPSSSAEVPRPDHSTSTPNQPNEVPEVVPKVREFRDAAGQRWRAWPVTPGAARPGRTAQRYLGEFHKGWICFEALESAGRRRLPMQAAHWAELPDSELVRLLDEAITAPVRKQRPDPSGDRAPSVD